MTTKTQKLANTRVTAFMATLLITAIPAFANAEGWELRTTERAVPGTSEIESGNADKAIRISRVRLPHASPQEEVAYLTNLCIGYIMKKDFETAESYCDEAVNSSTEKSVSFNNRGVLKALQGDYIGAMEDFSNAANAGCVQGCNLSANAPRDLPRPIARRNLGKAEVQARVTAEEEE
jgi:Tfp pilus assembly protein PilF